MRMRGKFIVLEGADGAGTTTQAEMLVDRIKDNGGDAIAGHTPSKGEIGKMTRQLIVRHQVKDWRVMQLLFTADMIEYTQNVIRPKLNDGVDFVCDRYYPSTLVYQSSHSEPYGREAAIARMEAMYEEIMGLTMSQFDTECGYPMLTPDVTILVDLDQKQLEERVLSRGEPIDAYESSKQRTRLVDLYNEWFVGEFDVCNREVVDGSIDRFRVNQAIWDIYKEINS